MKQPSVTLLEILEELRLHFPCGTATARRHIRRVRIESVDGRHCPQQYPPDAAARILMDLGYDQLAPNGHEKIVSLRQLKAERNKARKARAA